MAEAICESCGSESLAGAVRCGHCGVELPKSCLACGEQNPADHRFCGRCGAPLHSQARRFESDAPGPRPTALTPLKKERKHVTIFFADICESTTLIDKVDPEQAVDTFDPVLNAMRETIRRYGGTVNEVRGDGVMALFGAPVAQEDHALRACHAALALQQRIAELPGAIRVRVGLHSGTVVVRAIRNDLALDYTAVGPAVHLASRLEHEAQPGQILLSDKTRRLVTGFVATAPVGELRLRGIADPVTAFELLDSLEDRSRWEVRAERGLSRFVGRESELAELEANLRWAAAGYRRLAIVSGPAGVGKSRLVHELAQQARAEGWTVLETSATALTQPLAWRPIRRLLESWLEVEESEDSGRRARRLAEQLESLGPGAGELHGALEAVLDLPVSDPAWKHLDPTRRGERIGAAVREIVARVAELAPLVLVFEDLHWMDEETRAVLESLAVEPMSAPLYIVATTRDATPHVFGKGHTAIALDGLDDRSSAELLRASLGDHPALKGLIDLLVEKSGGVPLFLEETLSDLVETRALKGSPGNYRPNVSIGELEIPESIEAVLAARLDRLDPFLKELLRTCAVIGPPVPLDLLIATCHLDEPTLTTGLGALCRQDFLRKMPSADGDRFAFKHALTQDVAYQSLLRAERRSLHQRALAALELRHAGALRLGYHAYRGESYAKAAEYLQRAGLDAVRRSAHREALACFEPALASLEALPRSEETLRASIRTRMLIRGCLVPLGDAEQIERHLAAAERTAAEMGDTRWLGLVYATATYSDWLAGRHEAGVESGLRARAVARELGDLTLHVSACFGLGLSYHGLGRYREAVEVHEDLIARLPHDLEQRRFHGPAFPAVLGRAFLGYAHAELGDFAKAQAYAESAMKLAQQLEDPFGLVLSRIAAAQAALRMQDPWKAIEVLEPGVEECRRGSMHTVAVGVVAHLAIANATVGRAERAIRDLLEIVDVADDEEIPVQNLDRRLLALGFAHWVHGDVDAARESADEACESARRHGDDGTRGWGLLLSGLVRSGLRDASPDACFGEAISVARERSMVPLEAHALLESARWRIASGRIDAGRDAAGAAARLFRGLALAAPLREAERLGRTEND
ncbi:MAG TPA: adenylate/guanylate cyclase domain-containing protein [Myxococcota bacterium]|nr:adenylate/guanylate cyclase domain-containing protein [Myxococcota bacterium]